MLARVRDTERQADDEVFRVRRLAIHRQQSGIDALDVGIGTDAATRRDPADTAAVFQDGHSTRAREWRLRVQPQEGLKNLLPVLPGTREAGRRAVAQGAHVRLCPRDEDGSWGRPVE